MDPIAAFTVYFTDTSCAGNATRIAYDTSATCVPSASVTPCQQNAIYPNWHALQGCTNNYTATGTTYFGPVMQVQYQQTQPSLPSCSNSFGDGGQFPINQCVESLSTTSPYRSELIEVGGSLFQPNFYLTLFTDTRCMNASQRSLFGTDQCFEYNLINDYGWYQDVYGPCAFFPPANSPPVTTTSLPPPVLPSPTLPGSIAPNGPIPSVSNTSPNMTPMDSWIQTGRSLSQPCVPTLPSQACLSKQGILRSCSSQFNETHFNMQSLNLFDGSPFIQWTSADDSNVLSQTIFAFHPFVCTTVANDSVMLNSMSQSTPSYVRAYITLYPNRTGCTGTAANPFPIATSFQLRMAQYAGDSSCFLNEGAGCVWNYTFPVGSWVNPGGSTSESRSMLWLGVLPVVGMLGAIAFRLRNFINLQQGGGGGGGQDALGGGGHHGLQQGQSIEMGDPVLREGDGLPKYDDAAPEYAASPALNETRPHEIRQ
ncbi:hypothetical protein HDU98_009742 [Podochytrium sp. JEL0797]|nr:hypothetical protein HDU98_009742 [Podochytrium sp. JEL0797]